MYVFVCACVSVYIIGISCYVNSYILQVTHYLGGENYVFWGGREGYQTLLNTDMERELDHLVLLVVFLLLLVYILQTQIFLPPRFCIHAICHIKY